MSDRVLTKEEIAKRMRWLPPPSEEVVKEFAEFNEVLRAEVVRLEAAALSKRVARMAEAWKLTKREAEVLELIVQACTNKDIANRFKLAIGTVEIHVSRVIHKSKCASRAEVIVAAYTGVVP